MEKLNYLNIKSNNLLIKEKTRIMTRNEKIELYERKAFYSHKPDIEIIKKIAKKYSKFKNVILIGNGGAISTTHAFYKSLSTSINSQKYKKLQILNTVDPDYITKIKNENKSKDTLVIIVSSSGTNITPIEIMFHFIEYKIITIVNESNNALENISKQLNLDIITQPILVDRFAARSPMIYLPLEIIGINTSEIDKGIKNMYNLCSSANLTNTNPALEIAFKLYMLEQKGYDEIFLPIYSSRLDGFIPIIVQLMHESICKDEKGQTIIGASAPESQHHTNQRFFGGKKNIIGIFLTVEKPENSIKTKIPKELKNIVLRTGKLKDLDNINLETALSFEFKSTYDTAVNNGIPSMSIILDTINEKSTGELLGLFHYITLYSAILRDVNPTDQPHVEESKSLSFESRRKHK
ncbi:MAG: hypothetical protein K0B02_05450 [DPANN group archaeon]|nr:hypothetical protein [DPANN group archaeon]